MKSQLIPVFIFSLPRSGSTLLQKILASHEKISTHSETWLLLPFIYSLKKNNQIVEYNHAIAYNAFQEFISNLPEKEDDYYTELRKFVLNLYRKLSDKNVTYFVDKTPRYYYIISEIEKLFPNAKFIFLFRNPISIINSIVNTWCNGKFSLSKFENDLFIGQKLLIRGYQLYSHKSIMLNYETLVTKKDETISKIFKYLDLKYTDILNQDFSKSSFKGSFGDKNIKNYKLIVNNSLNEWQENLNTKFRINYLKKYLEYIGKEDLKIIGYDYDLLLKDLSYIDCKFDFGNDFFQYKFSHFYNFLRKLSAVTNLKKVKFILKKFGLYQITKKIIEEK